MNDLGATSGGGRKRARATADKAADAARNRVEQTVEQGTTAVGDRVSAAAEDLRAIAAQMEERGNASAARIGEQAASALERFGSYLDDADARRIFGDLEELARKQPAAAAAGAFMAGFAASRLVKTAAEREG